MIDTKDIEGRSGIYCIENIVSKKIYIGSSIDIKERVEQGHLRSLRLNEHPNRHLQNAYNKRGEGCFIVYVLEYCSEDKLIEREQYYFDTFLYAQEYISTNGADSRFIQLSYNLSPTATSILGLKHTEEQRIANSRRIRDKWQDPRYIQTQKLVRTKEWHQNRIEKVLRAKERDPSYRDRLKEGIRNSPKHQARKKPILLYDRFTGSFIAEYEGMIECERATGIGTQRLRAVLQGRSKYTHDKIVRYKTCDDFPLHIDPILNQYDDEQRRKQIMKKIHLNNSQPILAYDLKGRLINEYTNANEAAIRLGIGIQNAGGIRMVLYGRCEQCKGYRFKYKNPNYTPRKYKPRQVGVIN